MKFLLRRFDEGVSLPMIPVKEVGINTLDLEDGQLAENEHLLPAEVRRRWVEADTPDEAAERLEAKEKGTGEARSH